MRLLLVEDELEIQNFVKQSLTGAGFGVHTAEDEIPRLSLPRSRFTGHDCRSWLPGQDGIDLILRLRKEGMSGPVLILSARRSEETIT